MKYIDFYYAIKPLIPRRIQIALRRAIARKKLAAHKDEWPILMESEKAPAKWKGWPEQKKFALILSHDVDTYNGYVQCTRLLDLEQQMGFKSSFNFVPDDYYVSPDLRLNLKGAGFEVGLHGLKHDGRLYRSRKHFNKSVPRMNYFLKQWESVGFHSPAMHHNLEWTSSLDIEYANSTFDTDPFEPQPDGLKTIFPLCIRNIASQKEYIEIPYTLPQDHCLFIILKEPDIGIWVEKVDWIAKNGGMAFLNTHPDYMNFDGSPCRFEEYPVNHYIAFLEYIKTRYAGQYWHVLPRDLARFWRNSVCAYENNPAMVISGRAKRQSN